MAPWKSRDDGCGFPKSLSQSQVAPTRTAPRRRARRSAVACERSRPWPAPGLCSAQNMTLASMAVSKEPGAFARSHKDSRPRRAPHCPSASHRSPRPRVEVSTTAVNTPGSAGFALANTSRRVFHALSPASGDGRSPATQDDPLRSGRVRSCFSREDGAGGSTLVAA